MSAQHTATPQWEIDGKDGKAVLIVDANTDPDAMEQNGIRVYGPDREKIAADVIRACNAHDDLVKALQEAKQHLEYIGYGDGFERSGAIESKLPEQIAAALAKAGAA